MRGSAPQYEGSWVADIHLSQWNASPNLSVWRSPFSFLLHLFRHGLVKTSLGPAMLVLTRRARDKVSFPQVGITVHFLRVQPGQVKVGVEAPRDIAIVRDEIAKDQTANFVRRQLALLPRDIRHGIRNELHHISVGMHLIRELMQANLLDEANQTIDSLQDALKRLDQNESLRKPGDHGEETPRKSKIIVLIEDDCNQRKLLADFLRTKGFQVREFCDGEEAVAYFQENDPPGAILVDMKMPKLDGRSTVESLRQREQFHSVPIFAVSGTSPEENGLSMGSQGVNRWFPKPISVDTLVSAIDQSLDPDCFPPNNHVPA